MHCPEVLFPHGLQPGTRAQPRPAEGRQQDMFPQATGPELLHPKRSKRKRLKEVEQWAERVQGRRKKDFVSWV